MVTFDNLQDLPASAGIYLITNKKNGNKYVGQSVNIRRRFKSYHKSEFKNPNSSMYDSSLYKAMRKHGLDSFVIIVLEECERCKLNEREVYWIEKYNTYKNGYNSSPGGDSLPDILFTEEVEAKRRNTRLKNGSLQGEKHPQARLTEKEVLAIRQRYIDGESISEIFEDYKDLYKYHSFSLIIYGKSYKNVGNIPNERQKVNGCEKRISSRAKREHKHKLSKETREEIREKYKSGKYLKKDLVEEYGVSKRTMYNILHEK